MQNRRERVKKKDQPVPQKMGAEMRGECTTGLFLHMKVDNTAADRRKRGGGEKGGALCVFLDAELDVIAPEPSERCFPL